MAIGWPMAKVKPRGIGCLMVRDLAKAINWLTRKPKLKDWVRAMRKG
jgi:nitrous oxide reductase accessory protein NosL